MLLKYENGIGMMEISLVIGSVFSSNFLNANYIKSFLTTFLYIPLHILEAEILNKYPLGFNLPLQRSVTACESPFQLHNVMITFCGKRLQVGNAGRFNPWGRTKNLIGAKSGLKTIFQCQLIKVLKRLNAGLPRMKYLVFGNRCCTSGCTCLRATPSYPTTTDKIRTKFVENMTEICYKCCVRICANMYVCVVRVLKRKRQMRLHTLSNTHTYTYILRLKHSPARMVRIMMHVSYSRTFVAAALTTAVGFSCCCDIAVNLAIGKILTVFSVLFFLFFGWISFEAVLFNRTTSLQTRTTFGLKCQYFQV